MTNERCPDCWREDGIHDSWRHNVVARLARVETIGEVVMERLPVIESSAGSESGESTWTDAHEHIWAEWKKASSVWGDDRVGDIEIRGCCISHCNVLEVRSADDDAGTESTGSTLTEPKYLKPDDRCPACGGRLWLQMAGTQLACDDCATVYPTERSEAEGGGAPGRGSVGDTTNDPSAKEIDQRWADAALIAEEDPLAEAIWRLVTTLDCVRNDLPPHVRAMLEGPTRTARTAYRDAAQAAEARASDSAEALTDRTQLWKEGEVYHLQGRYKHRDRRLPALLAIIYQEYEGEDFKWEQAVADLITGLAQLNVDESQKQASDKAPSEHERST